MLGTGIIYIPQNKVLEFLAYKIEHPDIKPCDVYVDKKNQKIYFVEQSTEPVTIYTRDITLSDNCKAINSMGLS